MKKLIAFTIGLIVVFFLAVAYAGEKEDLKVAYLQEHIRALQMDFQMSQQELQKALAEKKAADEAEKKSEKK